MDNSDHLQLFHPLIRKWFTESIGSPTEVQKLAWPVIAEGEHVLATAPTGSGKTLAAFLWAIDSLVTGRWERGAVRVLYISPLRALNNDVRRNLITPLSGISGYFGRAGEDFPEINVLTRSGDTPQSERRRMIRKPPEILITTPESLNILLLNDNGRRVLSGIRTVILDEIHALADNRRGTHLATAVERLVPLCGEFQRIALSATVKPLDEVAAFAGGLEIIPGVNEREYRPRRVRIIAAPGEKRHEIRVEFPEKTDGENETGSLWPSLVRRFREEILKGKSTLFFCNSRRQTEKAARLINEDGNEGLACSHHGSLSREVRLRVEEMLKRGELRAIVATNTLELGIDIGDLDRVVLVQTPFSVSSALQRVGRAGHGVGETSRGVIFPTHGMDMIAAAVMARALKDRDLENVRVVRNPLDVLAQVILAMTAVEEWKVDDLFDQIRAAFPYRDLPREHFNLVLEMLSGRYAGANIRELSPRISLDRDAGTVRAMEGTARLLYMSGGTIPNRGYYDLRAAGSRAKIGELDEEFVFERSVGDTFALGNQVWKIIEITHNDVLVASDRDKPGIIPFWKADERSRDVHLSERLAGFLEYADGRKGRDDFTGELEKDYFMSPEAAGALAAFLLRQEQAAGCSLPHRHHLVIEEIRGIPGRESFAQVILHTLWGGMVNRPYAMALAAAWSERYGHAPVVISDNDCVLIQVPAGFDISDIHELVRPENFEELMRRKLERTGLFGARFRENAGRALLLPLAGFNRRLPLWINRLRSKKLLDAVMRFTDFPIMLETWRTCLRDDFDIDRLRELLLELRDGEIRVTRTVTTAPSPFAAGIAFRETSAFLYADDTPDAGPPSALGGGLIGEVAGSDYLRPRIPGEIIGQFEAKIRRLARGYTPASPMEILEWVKERRIIAEPEWRELLDAVRRDHGDGFLPLPLTVAEKLAVIFPPGASCRAVCAVEDIEGIAGALGVSPAELVAELPLGSGGISAYKKKISGTVRGDNDNHDEARFIAIEDLLLQLLRFSGPVYPEDISVVLGLTADRLAAAAASLEEEGQVLTGSFREDGEDPEICDRENLERLLRLLRKSRRSVISTLPSGAIPLFTASFQGLLSRGAGEDSLKKSLDRLFGYPAPTHAWEEYILPSRVDDYRGALLDSLFQKSDLAWFGCGKHRAAFSFLADLDLFIERAHGSSDYPEELFPDRRGRYGFPDIRAHSGLSTADATARLWDEVWKGRAANDTFEALRKGVLSGFKIPDADAVWPERRGRASGFSRWYNFQPMTGSWFPLPQPQRLTDPVQRQELLRERVRQILDRYGIVFRELCDRELPLLRWGELFRTLRIMELSGEISSGLFFEGIPGLQFMSREGMELLKKGLDEEAVYWMNASDPASLCGVAIDGLKNKLPARRDTTYIVFRGTKTVLTAARNGKSMDIFIDPGEMKPEYLDFCAILTGRNFNPLSSIRIESINGEAAAGSPYAGTFLDAGFRREYRSLVLRRDYSR